MHETLKLMTKIIKLQHQCLLINRIITNQDIYDAFSNNKRKNNLQNTEKMISHKKKLKNRFRSIINLSYALDINLNEDFLNFQINYLNSDLHLIRDLYIYDNELLINVFFCKKSEVNCFLCCLLIKTPLERQLTGFFGVLTRW